MKRYTNIDIIADRMSEFIRFADKIGMVDAAERMETSQETCREVVAHCKHGAGDAERRVRAAETYCRDVFVPEAKEFLRSIIRYINDGNAAWRFGITEQRVSSWYVSMEGYEDCTDTENWI